MTAHDPMLTGRFADPASRIIAKGQAALTAFNAARAGRTAAAAAPSAGEYATPLVRSIARRLGVDLATVDGTGAGGRVTPNDVRAAAPATTAPKPALPDDSYPAAWKRPEQGAASNVNLGAGTAYPAHWDRSPVGDDEAAPSATVKTEPAPRTGKHAGTAYPADWAL